MSTPRPRRARDPRRRLNPSTTNSANGSTSDGSTRTGSTRNGRSTAASSTPAARPSAPAPAPKVVDPEAGKGFLTLGVPDRLVQALVGMDRPNPFPVQSLTLGDSIAGTDVCVKAPTGSGKTLAFAIPVALRTRRSDDGRPRALILLPTRELAGQVAETLEPLARSERLRVATVYGGTNISRDLSRMRKGVDVVVATPGRLADLVERRAVDLSQVDVVVLDEADRMADMGFLPEVVRLLDRTSERRQTLLFSATLDGDVDTLIKRYQNDPVRHTLTEEPSAAGDVRHLFWPADRDSRRRLTGDVLRTVDPAIVFTRTKHGADRLVKQLHQDGISAAAIHGNRTQSQRERALESFRSGEVTTLVATDVAARGIHVDAVAVVLHYDLPGSEKDYQHRSGRTGRAGATGLVVSFVDPSQHKDTAAIQRSLALPEGLHDIDLKHLTSDRTPAVAQSFASAPRGTQGKGSGQGKSRGSNPASRGHSGRGAARTGAGTAGRTRGATSARSRSTGRRAG
jgi:superfamily II DNA/RNA helicase